MGGSGGVPRTCAGVGDATASLWLAESWWKSPPKADCMNIYEGGIWKITAVKSEVSESSVSSKDARQRCLRPRVKGI